MPKTYKPRRRAAARKPKRTYRRRAPNRRGQTSVTKIRGSVMPDKMIVKMPYVDYQKVNAAGGSNTPNYFQKTYALNSLYDPEPGVVGNSEPLGTLEWQQLYNKYRVFGASYEITLTNLSSDTSVAGCLYFASDGSSTGLAVNPTSWLAQPHSRRFTIGNREGSSKIVMKGYVSLPKYLDMTSAQYKMEEQTAGWLDGSIGPTQQINLFINTYNINTGIPLPSVQVMARITYHTVLFDRVHIIASGTGVETGETNTNP